MLHLNSSVVMVHFWKDISWSGMYLRQCHTCHAHVFHTWRLDEYVPSNPNCTVQWTKDESGGKRFLTETYFGIYSGRGIYSHWKMCCRGFPKVRRLDKVQGRSNNSYFFYNLDGWKIIFIVQWCFVLPPSPQFNIVKQKCTYWISEVKPRKRRLKLIWFVFCYKIHL